MLHYKDLKLYESLGLIVERIHRGIKFAERDWMRSYIKKNTELRKKGKNDF